MKKYTFLLLSLIFNSISAGKKITLIGYYGITEDAKTKINGRKTVKQFVEEQYNTFLLQFPDNHKLAWKRTMAARENLLATCKKLNTRL